jgi:hypothetical protein
VGLAEEPDSGTVLHGTDERMSTVRFEIPKAAIDALDRKLKGMGGIAQSQILLKGMLGAGRAVRTRAKELAPVAQTKGYDRKQKASVKSVPAYRTKAFVRDMEPILEVRVKAARKAPHFHLVELGHRIVTGGTADRLQGSKRAPSSKRTGERGKGKIGGRVPGQMFLSRGGKYSTTQQIAEMQKAVKSALRKLTGA